MVEVGVTERYDAIVIGAGQGGGPLARAFATAGRRTLLVERKHVGGTCVNEGCTPTKTMVASARVAYLARGGVDYGVRTGEVTVDLARVRDRKRETVASFRAAGERGLHAAGVELRMEDACFVAPRTIETDGGLRAIGDVVVINTGQRPARPGIPGLDEVGALDSTSIMELDVVPESLIVLGGGYVGVEFAQMFRRFGSRVTLIQRGAHLLAREDDDVADAIAQVLREDGIDVRVGTQTTRVTRAASGGVSATVSGVDGESTIDGSHLLVAAGRVSNTDQLGAAAADIALDAQGSIIVDERLATSAPGTFAIGDVKGGPAFTHISYDDFRILRTNLIEGGSATITGRMVPYTVFIDPQLGRIGMTERDARAAGRDIESARLPMSHVARAVEMGETRGFLKAVVDSRTERILGVAALGVEGGELASALQIAMMGDLPYSKLRDGIFSHPTLAESFNNLFSSLGAS
jgi:pyruvate/2-oxoglutarate dehydrogenase complex dihydrolipoamide dehydrogenase (E3) component